MQGQQCMAPCSLQIPFKLCLSILILPYDLSKAGSTSAHFTARKQAERAYGC